MPPKAIEGLEERLRSRFEGGLVVAIQPPDRALREKLYARYLARRGRRPTTGAARLSRRAPRDERARADRHRASAARRGGASAAVPLTLVARAARARAGGRDDATSPPATYGAADVVLPRRREDRVGVARRRRTRWSRSCADGDQGKPQGGEPPRRAAAAGDGEEDGLSQPSPIATTSATSTSTRAASATRRS